MKNRRIILRLTPDELEKIDKFAAAKHLTRSEYFRRRTMLPVPPGRFGEEWLDTLRSVGARLKLAATSNQEEFHIVAEELRARLAEIAKIADTPGAKNVRPREANVPAGVV